MAVVTFAHERSKSSGFEADLGRTATVHRVRLDRIAAPFLERVSVEGSGDRTRWTLLADATAQPWIYFESPDDAPLRNRYGNATLRAPAYDLEAYRSYVSTKNVARAKWGERTTGSSPSRPEKRASVPPPFGAVVDRDAFRVSRRLPDAPPGLTVLLLDAHALAHSNELRDLRLADAQGRQVPYLVEHRAEPLAVKLALPARHASGSRSIYRIQLPYAKLPGGTLMLTTGARVFEREVTVRQRRGGAISSATWRSSEPGLPPPALRLELPTPVPRTLELLVDEGDNAPLPVESVHLLLPAQALRFSHPGTPLFLLYGNPRAGAPRYDLSLLAPRLFGEPARELSLGAAPDVRAPDDDRAGRKLFWIGIVVAAVVLVAMLLRLVLVRTETSHAPSDTT